MKPSTVSGAFTSRPSAHRPPPGNAGIGEDRVEDPLDLVQHRLAHRPPGLGGQSTRRTREVADHHVLIMRQLPQPSRIQRPVRGP
ncbi:hypothetical protein Snoj_25790 [Streptomyces nojiriensis]|uniref:Uncharacterized protein n=1 Tax=Streptomyces nojiriensis TaxID=66374 RepID=A0ABQ3SKJ0_9ACTN|nr:hypothetical protein [Streptomyces nojiriensis]GGS29422.1 hypothetical protein GCM10010205_69390 [Streptomyces nojiriensis]GHI68661.1 hypothetical protein Snoj_25790 [Streptomyces nojiriensis]